MKAILVIAGSDSSGGAGVQTDLRWLNRLGRPAVTAITAVTAQGPNGVTAIQDIEPGVVAEQIEQAFQSYEIGGVKIGMLGNAEIVKVIIDCLKRHQPRVVVLDPVLTSTSGTPLLDDEGRRLLVDELIPLTTLVTPNIPEAEVLSGIKIESDESLEDAGENLLELGAKMVLITGGHLPGDPVDTLFTADKPPVEYRDVRVDTEHTRGTGCMLSTLITAHLSGMASIDDAIGAARTYVRGGLTKPVIPANGKGYPSVSPSHFRGGGHEERLRKIEGIYFVSDAKLNPETTHAMGARMAAEGGAQIVQLREKNIETRELVELARHLKHIAHKHGALFIQNDRVDVAAVVLADGVHLGPDDMSPTEARKIIGPEYLIGVSVSTLEEAMKVGRSASYLAIGAIFGSSTKGDAGDPVGVERITEIRNAFPDKRIVAIGGINMSNIASVAAAGADAAAVVSAIVCADDPLQATHDLLAEFERGKGK